MKLGFIFDISDLPPPPDELIIVHPDTSTARIDYRPMGQVTYETTRPTTTIMRKAGI
jgi:hypothetical protein